MTAALFDIGDVPPVVPRALRVPWAAAVLVVGIDASAVDVGYERPHRGRRARLGSTYRDWRGTDRLSVHVRPHLTGDELLCVLLHEAVHVKVHQTQTVAAMVQQGPHGQAFKSEVDAVCDRLGIPPPNNRRHRYWPDGRGQQAVVSAAVMKEMNP